MWLFQLMHTCTCGWPGWMQLTPCRLVLRCLRHPPVLSLSCRQQERFLSEGVTPVQQIYPVCAGAGSAAAGVSEGMNGSNMNSTASADRLIWVDLEMTGLDVDTDHILEMACIITDGDMNIIAEGPDLIVHQPDSVLEAMGPWCQEHHGKSGLTEACRLSKLSLTELEDKMLAFVQQHTPVSTCPLAGNTVHMDKRFLDKYMKRFSAHLHYRIVDVSSVKELCKRWYPRILPPRKQNKHRALDDILESIKELKFYKENIFR